MTSGRVFVLTGEGLRAHCSKQWHGTTRNDAEACSSRRRISHVLFATEILVPQTMSYGIAQACPVAREAPV